MARTSIIKMYCFNYKKKETLSVKTSYAYDARKERFNN